MGVAVGSATQVSMFVVPVAVLSGWAMVRRGCSRCSLCVFDSLPAELTAGRNKYVELPVTLRRLAFSWRKK